jgi:hypothetical protein
MAGQMMLAGAYSDLADIGCRYAERAGCGWLTGIGLVSIVRMLLGLVCGYWSSHRPTGWLLDDVRQKGDVSDV